MNEKGLSMTNRIGILKDAFVNAPRQVDVQRAVLITESYKRNEKETEVMKRALALYDILTGIDIEIREHELIAGNHTLFRRGAPLFPEYATDWLSAQMDDFSTRPGDRFQITEEQKKVVYTCLDYWYGKSLRDRVMAEVPRQIKDVLDTGIISNVNYTMSAPGHVVPDYAYLLRTGFSGIIAECEERRAMFEKGSEQYSFYNACIVSSNAIIAFAQRYSLLAEELASKENNPERKKELEIIARNCAAVPKNPASSYWEALQFILFVQLAMQLEGNGLAISIGRLDRNIGFLYDQDISSGRIERERALELMECFYIKLGEIDKIYSNEATRALQGPAHGQTITVGGTDENGIDVTNEVTFLVLDADYDVRLVQPDIAVRIHDGTPD
ncbi:MAG: hypothetical protein LBT68_08635, partial [Spirochaetales bacterium]|nr:hypothetical protein [Spirochaetales bacterium]